MDLQVLFYVFLGGLLPAALWLWFWLKEDSAHPEPRGLIFVTFIAGMIAVILVLPIQEMICSNISCGPPSNMTASFFLALVEEIMKFLAAYAIALRSRAFDEPIDAVIFMVTAALGFTALENALYIFDALSNSGLVNSIVTGNMRFIGASLLHIMTSSVVGLSLALSFYKTRMERWRIVFCGVIGATALHTLFNLTIISNSSSNILLTFLVLWFSVVGLLLFFEKIKRLNQINTI